MRKTININLDGYPFQIEEDAYDLLRAYLQRLETKLGKTDEAKEVVGDIESRIAELFRMENRNNQLIITCEQVSEVIQTIGEPDDIIDHKEETGHATETESESSGGSFTDIISKRLYRNPSDKVLGGVCSGLASYFNIDVLIVRVLFVLGFLLSAGTIVTLGYLILWIVIPKAILTEQKLAMQGGISFSDPISRNKSSVKAGAAPSSAPHAKSSYWAIALRNIGKSIVSIIGFFVFLFGVLGLLAMGIIAISGYSVIHSSLFGFHFDDFVRLLTNDGIGLLMWIAVVAFVALPLVLLMYLGLRMMVNFKAYLGVVVATMVLFWLMALGVIVYKGLNTALSFAKSCDRTENISLQPLSNNVLHISRLDSSRREGSIIDELSGKEYGLFVDSVTGKPMIFGVPDIRVEYGDSLSCRLITGAYGRDLPDAMRFRQQIRYRIRQVDSVIYCDERFSLGKNSFFRNQKAKVIFTIPRGTRVLVDPEMSQLVEF